MKTGAAILAAFLFAACSNASKGSGTGSTADAGETVGDQCQKIAVAYCSRGITNCGYQDNLDTCTKTNHDGCCVDKCSSPAISADADIDGCVAAINAMSCNDFATQNLPANCKGVVKRPTSFEPTLYPASFGANVSSEQ